MALSMVPDEVFDTGTESDAGTEARIAARVDVRDFIDDDARQQGALKQPLLRGSGGDSSSLRASVDVLTPSRLRRGSVQGRLDDPTRTGTIAGSILNLINSMIGIGVLALPSAFADVGFVVGGSLLLACCLWCILTLIMVSSIMNGNIDKDGKGALKSYPELVEHTIGIGAARATSCLLCVYLFGVCVSYSIVVTNTTTDLLESWNAMPSGWVAGWTNGVLDTAQFVLIVLATLILYPLSLVPSVEKIRYVSLIATLAMLYLGLAVAIRGGIALSRDEIPCVIVDSEPEERCPALDVLLPEGEWVAVFGTFSTTYI